LASTESFGFNWGCWPLQIVMCSGHKTVVGAAVVVVVAVERMQMEKDNEFTIVGENGC